MTVMGRGRTTADVRDVMFRVRRPSGGSRWLHPRCRGRTGSTGRPVRTLGVAADLADHAPDVEATGRRERNRRADGDRTVWLDARLRGEGGHRRGVPDRLANKGSPTGN
ncbi:hypothetical protein SUDANB105_00514 [Streptomyces sp. enrichment culture]